MLFKKDQILLTAKSFETHGQWLNVVRSDLQAYLADQELFVDIIYNEAKAELNRVNHGEDIQFDNPIPYVSKILKELGLKLSIAS